MQHAFFFRNVKTYEELVLKTKLAQTRNSVNRKTIRIAKTIELEKKEFDNISSHLWRNNIIFVDNKNYMRIENGVWICILLKSQEREIAVMSDGYQYARFVALVEETSN